MCLAFVDTVARPDTLYGKLYRHLSNALVGTFNFECLARFSVKFMVHRDAPEDVREELVNMSTRIGAETYRRQNAAIARRRDYRPTLSSIAVPTALIVGANDRMTPEKLSKEIHACIKGSTLQIVDACGHLSSIEQPGVWQKLCLSYSDVSLLDVKLSKSGLPLRYLAEQSLPGRAKA